MPKEPEPIVIGSGLTKSAMYAFCAVAFASMTAAGIAAENLNNKIDHALAAVPADVRGEVRRMASDNNCALLRDDLRPACDNVVHVVRGHTRLLTK